jgi:ABC-type multidrug transport system ATPase subunit
MLKMALMKVSLQNAGKRYNREWIFRGISKEFFSSKAYAITGPNGSGKSTLLQSLGGMLQLSEGTINYALSDAPLAADDMYKEVSFCAPYLDVIEEMTLLEFLHFHQQFKSFLPSVTIQSIITEVGLDRAAARQIRVYSSGMKQRVKLAQAIFSNTPVVLLDEPCSNLDATGIELYHSLIGTYCAGRLVIVCSNDKVEYSFCHEVMSVMDYKGTASPSPSKGGV